MQTITPHQRSYPKKSNLTHKPNTQFETSLNFSSMRKHTTQNTVVISRMPRIRHGQLIYSSTFCLLNLFPHTSNSTSMDVWLTAICIRNLRFCLSRVGGKGCTPPCLGNPGKWYRIGVCLTSWTSWIFETRPISRGYRIFPLDIMATK
jgi:hypothetical protein